MGGLGFDIKEDVTNLAGLIFHIVQFLDDSLFRSCDFCELFIRFYVSKLLKLCDSITFLDVEFFHTSLFDLFAEIR